MTMHDHNREGERLRERRSKERRKSKGEKERDNRRHDRIYERGTFRSEG